MLLGYGRVSTNKQDAALQEDAFRRAGVHQVITEKWSSVGHRPELMRLLARLGPGDELVVWKLDRMGRSLQDLLAILDRIQATGAAFRSLTEPIDTRTHAGRLMFSILGAVAEFERSIIRERSTAGIHAAIARGVKWGPRRKLSHHEELEVLHLIESGWPASVVCDAYGIARTLPYVYRVRHSRHKARLIDSDKTARRKP